MRTLFVLVVVSVAGSAGCGMDMKVIPGDCDEKLLCPAGNVCVNNFCVAVDDGGAPMDGGVGDAVGGDARSPDAADSCSVDIHCQANKPLCENGTCVQCKTNAQCAGTPNTPFCVANACVGCAAAPVNACAVRSGATPACGPSGACVECTPDSQAVCTGAKPVCGATNTCVGCTSDAQCTGKPSAAAPGICMDHEDGRCATADETVIDAGDIAASVRAALEQNKRLVVVTGESLGAVQLVSGNLSIVGNSGAAITNLAGPAVDVQGGSLYLRNVSLTKSKRGLLATGGKVLMHGGSIVRNDTGVLLNGASLGFKGTPAMPVLIDKNDGYAVNVVSGSGTFENVTLSNNGSGMVCLVPVELTNVQGPVDSSCRQ